MTLTDGLIIMAIILGPILSVQIQKLIEKIRSKKKRKEEIFKTLMITRSEPLNRNHVQALNRIFLEFDSNQKADKKVRKAWKEYLDHLENNYPQDIDSEDYLSELARCREKSRELLTNLLRTMSEALGYKFDKVEIKRDVYVPQYFEDRKYDLDLIRSKIADVCRGEGAIPVAVLDVVDLENNQESTDDQ